MITRVAGVGCADRKRLFVWEGDSQADEIRVRIHSPYNASSTPWVWTPSLHRSLLNFARGVEVTDNLSHQSSRVAGLRSRIWERRGRRPAIPGL